MFLAWSKNLLKRECNTRTSQEVTHPSTTLAQARSSDGIRCFSAGMIASDMLLPPSSLILAPPSSTINTSVHSFPPLLITDTAPYHVLSRSTTKTGFPPFPPFPLYRTNTSSTAVSTPFTTRYLCHRNAAPRRVSTAPQAITYRKRQK